MEAEAVLVGEGKSRAVRVAEGVGRSARAAVGADSVAGTELELFGVSAVAVVLAESIVAGSHALVALGVDVSLASGFVRAPDVHAHVLVGDTSVLSAELVFWALLAAALAILAARAVLHALPAGLVSAVVALVFGVLIGGDALASDAVGFGDAVDTAFVKSGDVLFLDVAGCWWRALVEAARATPGAFVVAGASIDAGCQVAIAVLGAFVVRWITRTHACLVIGITFAGTFLL